MGTLYKLKTYKHNPKVNSFAIALVTKKKKKKKRQIKLGGVGTMVWRFNTRLNKIIKKEWTKTIAN